MYHRRRAPNIFSNDSPRTLVLNTMRFPLLLALSLVFASGQLMAQTPSDAEIREILVDRIDKQKRSIGIVVGIVDESGQRIVAHGKTAVDGEPVDGDTVFEIGSVTKVFTALLLADMVQDGIVSFDDQIEAPPGITLDHLTRQVSGLPRMPANFKPANPRNPYVDYTVEQMRSFLADLQPDRAPGDKYEYSNLGVGLLGVVLAESEDLDYEALARKRILGPLQMADTSVALSASQQSRLAHGHNRQLQPASNWDLPAAFVGAGGLRSTVNDMLRFMAAAAGLEPSPLDSAFQTLLETRSPAGGPRLEIARGWHIFTGDPEIIWHNGGTGGYRSVVGYAPETKTAVVVLSNSTVSVDDIGRRLLDGKSPLMEAPKQRQEISLSDDQLERFVGRYQLAPSFIITVTREGDRLFAQATGQGRAQVFPESETKFFYKVTEAQLEFQTDSDGEVDALTLHQGGRSIPANRLD